MIESPVCVPASAVILEGTGDDDFAFVDCFIVCDYSLSWLEIIKFILKESLFQTSWQTQQVINVFIGSKNLSTL